MERASIFRCTYCQRGIDLFKALPVFGIVVLLGISGCGSNPTTTETAPTSAAPADQERLQREALKNMGAPGAVSVAKPDPVK